jgi:hypothetical protein
MNKKIVLYLTAVVILSIAQISKAGLSTNALWTFETSVPNTAGPYNPEIGTGSALGHHAGTATYSTPTGDGSSHSYSANVWAVADYWQFSTTLDLIDNTYNGFAVSFEQTGSATGPGTFSFQYSTDGSTFTAVGADYTLTSGITWSSSVSGQATVQSFDLSAITALNTASTVYFRIVDDGTANITGGAIGTSGTDRVDDFLITSSITLIPEPSTLAFAAMGIAGCLLVFRSRRYS